MAQKPAKQRHQAQVSHEVRQQVRQELFQGPLPHPDILQQYDLILPGAAERIIAMAETEISHRHSQERKMLDSDMAMREEAEVERQRGQSCAVIVTLVCMGAAVACAYLGAFVAAGIIGGGTVVGLVTAFIAGRKAKEG